jgi:hypothetical protein
MSTRKTRARAQFFAVPWRWGSAFARGRGRKQKGGMTFLRSFRTNQYSKKIFFFFFDVAGQRQVVTRGQT